MWTMREKGVLAMAVLIEAISVVIRCETIAEKYPDGVDQYINLTAKGVIDMNISANRPRLLQLSMRLTW